MSDPAPLHPEPVGGTGRAHWRLHRLLIRRIAGTAVLLAALLAVMVYLLEQNRIRVQAVELAVQRATEFASVAGAEIAAPGAAQRGDVQTRLDAFARGRVPPREGRIVAAMLYDAGGTFLAKYFPKDDPQRDAITAFLASQPATVNVPAAPTGHGVAIAGTRYIFAQLPMQAAEGRVIGRLQAVFAPSSAYLHELQLRVWRTVAATIAVVLCTAAVLYPVILRLMRRVTQLTAELLEANLEILSVMGGAIAKRDADTDAHNYRVTIYSVRLAEACGLDSRSMQALIKGAFLHDVGKIGVPDHILLKPGKLSEAEFAEMQKHVDHGLDIVHRATWLADAEAVVGYHHRKFDGSGYGADIRIAEIPIIARIFAIADVFDALTSQRPYKEPFNLATAMEMLEQCRGSHFDPQLLDAFAVISEGLYAAFANRDDGHPRQELQNIVARYFKQDAEMLLS